MKLHRAFWLAIGCLGCAGNAPPPKPVSGVQLHVGPWTLEPGEEINRCVVFKLEDTMLVDGFESWSTGSVHHFQADATIADVPAGESADCSAVMTEEVMKYSQVVFSTDRPHFQADFPPGVAGKLSAGFTNLIVSYHSINASQAPQIAEGYLNLRTTSRERVRTLINGLVGFQQGFSLEPHSESSVTARCRVHDALDVLALSGHAHQRMLSFETRLVRRGVRPEAPDYRNADWQTSRIDVFSRSPIHLEPGDLIEWTCRYRNDGDEVIRQGSTAAHEMCNAIVVYAPDQGYLSCDPSPSQPEQDVRQLSPPGTF